MENKKVSIIVPVYKVEAYLDACVQSLLAQTYENLEIILVDDASPDRSGAICDGYAARDNRVRVIHKSNGGAASARNAGIDKAVGDCICFVDADDVICSDYVTHLLQAMEESGADIAACGLMYMTRKQKIAVEVENCGIYSADEYLLEFTKSWTCALMTNKLFKRSVIGTIRFEEGHCIDDEFFTYLVVMNSNAVVVTSNPLYLYRMRGSSVMQDMLPNLQRIMLDRIEYITVRYQNVAFRRPNLEEAFFSDMLDTVCRYWHHSKDMPKAQQEIRHWVKVHTRRILTMRIPLRQKLGYLKHLYLTSPKIMAEPNPIQMDSQEYFD